MNALEQVEIALRKHGRIIVQGEDYDLMLLEIVRLRQVERSAVDQAGEEHF